MDRAPFAPRPEYLPRPLPMPCPMRCFLCFCPRGGLSLLRFILVLHDCEEMRNLRDHAAKRRRIRPKHHAIHGLQPQRAHNGFMFLGAADGAADQLDLDPVGLVLGHPKLLSPDSILAFPLPEPYRATARA